MIWKWLAEGFWEEDLILKHEINLRAYMNIRITFFIFSTIEYIIRNV
jgi:hypothetical protein